MIRSNLKRVIAMSSVLVASITMTPTLASASSNPATARAMKILKEDPEARAAFHQWITGWYFHQWLLGLEAMEAAACGGDLPPCYVMYRESKGNPYAVNPGHMGAPYGDPGDPWSHASGKWQFMPGTWNDYMGYPYAAAAPASVQNDKAREVWADGAGAGNWACC